MAELQKNDSLKLTIPGKLSYFPIARLFVQETAVMFGFEGNDLYKIVLAMEEAVTNVMKHAFVDDEQDTIDIICEQVPLGMKIVIREKGIPFDPEQLPEYKPAADLDSVSTSGMGIFLMRESMDEVAFHNLGMEGKETHLVKYLPAKNIEEYLTAEEKKQDKETPVEVIRGKIDYEVRRMSPSEAIEISRCAYKSHGYTFFDDHIYYPDRLIELNKSDLMISAIAVTPENVFMGHAALVYPSLAECIAELTFIFVNQEYRGQGCMAKLSDFLFLCPKTYPLEGIYVYSVTNHEFTQRGVHGFGIRDCGLLLASSPETWVFKGISGDSHQRISVALSFKYLSNPESLNLYPPPHHVDMVKRLYEHIGARDHRFSSPEHPNVTLSNENAVIETEFMTTENCAEIHVIRYGWNILRETKKILRELCLKHVAAIQLFLPLKDPATYLLTEEFEALGFFFSGILPMSRAGDSLILQYLNNVVIDYDKIVLYTELAKEIREYIRSRDPYLALC
jgi:serine/threonine-protein kinase RsbW